MDDEDARAPREIDPEQLEPRPPGEEDLVRICRRLNELGARYNA